MIPNVSVGAFNEDRSKLNESGNQDDVVTDHIKRCIRS